MIVVASVPLTAEAWEPFQQGEVLVISEGQVTARAPALESVSMLLVCGRETQIGSPNLVHSTIRTSASRWVSDFREFVIRQALSDFSRRRIAFCSSVP